MAVSANWYRKADLAAYNKEIDFGDGNVKVLLLTNAYTPDLDAHDYYNDVSAYEVSSGGTGYTTGGAALGSPTLTYTAANSWGTAHATGTAYAVGDVVRPASGNGYLYRCNAAGTSGGSAPTWPTTIGAVVADNTASWTCVGKGAIVFDGADTSWATATITARYAAIYYSSGTAATSPLLTLLDFGADVSSTAATFQVQWASQGIAQKFVH